MLTPMIKNVPGTPNAQRRSNAPCPNANPILTPTRCKLTQTKDFPSNTLLLSHLPRLLLRSLLRVLPCLFLSLLLCLLLSLQTSSIAFASVALLVEKERVLCVAGGNFAVGLVGSAVGGAGCGVAFAAAAFLLLGTVVSRRHVELRLNEVIVGLLRMY